MAMPRLPGAAATEVMLRASTRRSSSSRRAPANPAASPAAPTARPQLVLRSSRAASRRVISRSLSTVWLTSGRRTLTTTRAPDIRVAACTWAMDAAAIGVRSKLANTSLTSAPSSDRSTCSTAGHGTPAASSCSRLSSVAPMTSADQDRAVMVQSGPLALEHDHRRGSRLHPADGLKRAGHPPPLGGVAVEVAFELAGVEWPAEHLVFHVLSFHSNRTGWFSQLGVSLAWSLDRLPFGTCCRDDHVLCRGGHRGLQLTGAAGVGAQAADAGARSSGAGAGMASPPWSRRNGG